MWEYSEKVLEHYRNPRNVGKIDDADLIGEAGSLACGDSLKLYLKLDGNTFTGINTLVFETFSTYDSSLIQKDTALYILKGEKISGTSITGK